MPEGPEVQTVVNGLNNSVTGKTITGSTIIDAEKLPVGLPADLFNQLIAHQKIARAHRRGKYINIELESGEFIVIHLMMTGHLALVGARDEYPRFTRLALHFQDGSALCFADQRRFGTATLLRPDQMATYRGFLNLGIDIYGDEFTLENFAPLFTSRRIVHTFLLDQSKISGLGNIYVNEALFRAGIHPLRPADALNQEEIARLFEAAREVTRQALYHQGTTFYSFSQPDGEGGNFQAFLRVFRKEGDPCPNCGAPIARVRINNRSAFYCPEEQR